MQREALCPDDTWLQKQLFDCGEVGDLWRYDPKHASALEEADDSPGML